MSDVVQFFLKMATNPDEMEVEPPYLLQFGIPRNQISNVRQQGAQVLSGIREQNKFANDSHAAQYAIADAVISNGHGDPKVQQILATLVVHLATDSAPKLDALKANVDKAGYVMSFSDDFIAEAESRDDDDREFGDIVETLLGKGRAPFKFRFVALTAEA